MFSRTVLCVSALVIALCFLGAAAQGQDAPGPGAKPATAMPALLEVPLAAQSSDHFDAVAATNAYLAQIPEEARSRSDAYFEGGYWLILWDFLCGAIINFLFLQFRWSASMRNAAERATRFRPLQTLIYWAQFLVVSTVLGFPLTVYEG
jgi:STE24 endopeptidase